MPPPAPPTKSANSRSHLAVVEWARSKQDGKQTIKPGCASQWTVDELKRKDASEGGSRHMSRYKACKGTLEKAQISMELALDPLQYDNHMKAYSNSWRGETHTNDTEEGWMTLERICKIEHIPSELSKADQLAMALELVTDRKTKSRPHRVKTWADRGIKEYYYSVGGLLKKSKQRGKQCGWSKEVDVDRDAIVEQTRMIDDELDKAFGLESGSNIKMTKEDKLEAKQNKEQDRSFDYSTLHLYMYTYIYILIYLCVFPSVWVCVVHLYTYICVCVFVYV